MGIFSPTPNILENPLYATEFDKSKYFGCNNQEIIDLKYRCDCNNDCGDWSDEKNCETKISRHYLTCKGKRSYGPGRCIPRKWQCNSFNDCGNFYDEIGCKCSKTRKCARGLKCQSGKCCRKNGNCEKPKDHKIRLKSFGLLDSVLNSEVLELDPRVKSALPEIFPEFEFEFATIPTLNNTCESDKFHCANPGAEFTCIPQAYSRI